MTVSAVGVFAGNAGNPVPAHTGLVDYFFNTAAPIVADPRTPVITTQPADRLVPAGTSATFAVAVDGLTPLAFQWSRDGVAIPDATAAVYVTPPTTSADSGALFAVTVSNSVGTLVSRAARLTVNSAAPLIDIWQGPEQTFGALGRPQWAVNLLGNASDSDGLGALSFSLNGGAARNLSVGPFRRLEAAGDFNVEIPFAELQIGVNLVEIRAADRFGYQATRTVTLQYPGDTIRSLGETIDWSATTRVEDVAQVVDGRWDIVGNTLRPTQMGYDRLVAIGDLAWTDYEVTVPVTIHGFDTKGFIGLNSKPAVGVMLKWPGHSDWTGAQPTYGYYPVGGGAWYEFEQNGTGKLRLTDFQDLSAADPLGRVLATNVTYLWKVRVETQTNGSVRYRAKVWESTASEPAIWQFTAATKTPDVAGGSLLLVAHYTDVSFGNITIAPANTPPVAVNDIAAVSRGGVVGIDVLSNDSDPDGTLDPSSVSIRSAPAHGTLAVTVTGIPTYRHDGSDTTSDSFTYTVRDTRGAESNIATVTIGVTAGHTIVFDDFDQSSLNTALWSFIDPRGDAGLTLDGTRAVLSVPGGLSHDIWTAGNFAPRLMQTAPNTDFEIEVKFDSPVTQRYQLQGLVVEESPGRFIRFDVHHDGTRVRVFAATINNGTASTRHNVASTLAGSPLYLRLTRQGDLWTPHYSRDGVSWISLNGFNHAMTVSAVGVFAGNAGNPVPAHTGLVDYFLNKAAP
jgi:hypothetical protein